MSLQKSSHFNVLVLFMKSDLQWWPFIKWFETIQHLNQWKKTHLFEWFRKPYIIEKNKCYHFIFLNENSNYDNKVDAFMFCVITFFILSSEKMHNIPFVEQVTGIVISQFIQQVKQMNYQEISSSVVVQLCLKISHHCQKVEFFKNNDQCYSKCYS